MNLILFCLLGIFLLFIQGIFKEIFIGIQVMPELINLFLIWLARSKHSLILNLWLILVLGFIQDAAYDALLGYHALYGQLLFYGFYLFFGIFRSPSNFQMLVISSFAGVVFFFFNYLMTLLLLDSSIDLYWDDHFLSKIGLMVLFTVVSMPILFKLLDEFEYYFIRHTESRL